MHRPTHIPRSSPLLVLAAATIATGLGCAAGRGGKPTQTAKVTSGMPTSAAPASSSGATVGATPPDAVSDTAPIELARWNGEVHGLASDGKYVYWGAFMAPTDAASESDRGKVLRVPVTGGTPTVLATHQFYVNDIAIDTRFIYWIAVGYQGASTLMKMPLTGGTPVAVTTRAHDPILLAVDGTFVYWINEGAPDSEGQDLADHSLLLAPAGGGAAMLLAAKLSSPGQLVANAAGVFWTHPYDLMRLRDGAPASLLAGISAERIALDANSIYWTDSSDPGGGLKRMGLDGGSPTTLAPDCNVDNCNFAVDQTGVYWLDHSTQNLSQVGPDGRNPRLLRAKASLYQVGDMALDGSGVYWTEWALADEGKIARVVKWPR